MNERKFFDDLKDKPVLEQISAVRLHLKDNLLGKPSDCYREWLKQPHVLKVVLAIAHGTIPAPWDTRK